MNKIAMICAGLLLAASGASAADGARELFQRIDINRDRMLQFGEIQSARVQLFDRMDGPRQQCWSPYS
ncbi:MAG: hypothetical protein E5X53_02435 [Mesorhizobium sp.]|uniref:hypothetical protein n=1 Tax=Mesorhizobium sp. TaxID=1871066 RepID=UPI000FE459F4|nr:hypothetical protein [Mesorhizobium sp.]RWM20379.1 MAG: hypothetical protein EOR73_15260 [Mesorhizobium sp.]TIP74513.1 MAG: hypothetical protein E5X55_08045 [Mesorhizobium sp.]TIQ15032.1 MAG: hypothetical protein E5X57_00150 [Mesorhizobium sp.]TIR53872.1 MAG: hypothetical protein E5X53_02435 [Mesorhizobium sp.]TJW00131.1 MAG: hypothetical protein E5X52_00150 [Mesorhizobium sp.]